MNKITLKLIKNFFLIITFITLTCFFVSSTFLVKSYMSNQYRLMKNSAEDIHAALKSNSQNLNVSSSAVLIKNGDVQILGNGKMGVMPLLKHMDENSLQQEGKFKSPMGDEFLYYCLDTDLGKIVVVQSSKLTAQYLHSIYVTLLIVFIAAIILAVPMIIRTGKKLTDPIIKLQRASTEIANGNFKVDMDVDAEDEIKDLSCSLKEMAEKLEKRHALQRDFIANVSHDFKTPLSIIRNYSEAIHDEIVTGDSKVEYSGEIIREVDRLNSMVMDLLQLSKLQSGSIALNKEFFSLDLFLNSCTSNFKLSASAKDIDLETITVNAEIHADKAQLYRVMYNFIDNAIKFSNAHSSIKVWSYVVDDSICMSVINHGMVIPPDKIADIWFRYEKHSLSGGVGLGLPICAEILNLHGFQYGVTSDEQNGTNFFFMIPEQSFKII